MPKEEYSNHYSKTFGVLCFAVAYMHSNWVGGFDIYTFGLDIEIVRKLSNIALLTVVPAFFVLWGYLSNKYLYDSDVIKFSIRNKLFQFYPLYLIVFIINILLKSKSEIDYSLIEFIGGILGIYHRSGFYGGNIYIVVFFVIVTVSLIRIIPGNVKFKNMVFAVTCLFLAKLLPHESVNCYIRYFGYYTAFFLGVLLKDHNFFDKVTENNKLFLFVLISACFVPLLNFMGVKILEIQYLPNSPEQLIIVVAMICLIFKLTISGENVRGLKLLYRFFDKIGNYAYFHFMFHALIIHALTYILRMSTMSAVMAQIIIILLTSYVTVFIALPIYRHVFGIALRPKR
jgi:hypothetical protein